MHHPIDRIAHTMAFVTPVVEHWLEREIAQWVHHMKDRSDDPSHHERTPVPQSYISLPSGGVVRGILRLGRKEENVLFNDAFSTFYFTVILGVGHMVKDHSDSKRGNLLNT